MPAIQFSLLAEPPSAAQIQMAKERLTQSVKAAQARRRKLLFAWAATVVIAAACVGVYAESWWAFGLAIVVPTAITALLVEGAEPSQDERLLRSLDLVGAFNLPDVLRACELDERVEVYRRKVAQQPRDLVLAEAEACRYWLQYGYADSCNWAAVRSPEPLEFENREAAMTVGPALGRSVDATAE